VHVAEAIARATSKTSDLLRITQAGRAG
jgi:hypothetical protein